jgi:GTP-binding protein EngB required for normal cell division
VRGFLGQTQLLSERQQELLEQERQLLEQLIAALGQFGVDVAPADMRALRDTLEHLDELFLLVIAGEFNSGKSSFINALLGDEVQREGVTPTTDRITLLRYGAEPSEEAREEFLLERTFPADVLRQVVVVDTPGTNAVIRRHEELTRDFIPRSDMVLFVTSSDRPFSESERAFLEMIKQWGKKVVLILNKIDQLTAQELEQQLEFIRSSGRDALGISPEVFPISARLARRAKSSAAQPGDWEASRFEGVERFVVETLDEEERVRLKLLSPLGVAQRVADKYLTVVDERLSTLQADFATLDNIDKQVGLFRDDLGNDFQYHISEIKNILHEMELRGIRFFDDELRLGKAMNLVRGDAMQAEFERVVVADSPAQIEGRVQVLIDWMVEKNLRIWQAIMDYLTRQRVPSHQSGIIGEVGGAFDYNRQELINSVGNSAQRIVQTYDRHAESEALANEVRGSIAGTAIAEVGAVGLGALLVTLFHTALLDFTGVLLAGVVAVGGLYLLPTKRRQLKRQFQAKIGALRDQLVQNLTRQFSQEMDQSEQRIREAITPYTRFVRSQREQLDTTRQALVDIQTLIGRLRAEIGTK